MVLDEPLETEENDLTPSFDKDTESAESAYSRSSVATQVLVDYEKKVTPSMLEMDWMSLSAKSTSAPFYNSMDQNMMAHILPGVEVISDICEKSPTLKSQDDLRDLISLWTIHDIHKIVEQNQEEFSIDLDTVKDWVKSINVKDFDSNLDYEDYHSCCVALHNTGGSNMDDSTTRFTQLRPALRLTDSILSISRPSDFTEQAERPVAKVFSRPSETYQPASHTVEFDDEIIRTIVNKTIRNELCSRGYQSIDIRDNGVLYVRPSNVDKIEADDFTDKILHKFLSNLREAFQMYRNPAFLGSNMNTSERRLNHSVIPSVYDISHLSRLCLSNTQIIQRIVQASVRQQNSSSDISEDSESQIEMINDATSLKIQKTPFIEGLATLVHTVYKNILPEVIDSKSDNSYERTIEAGLLYIFGVDDYHQKQYLKTVKSDDVTSSAVSCPSKYVIADNLHKDYTKSMSRKDREEYLIRLILDRLEDFEKWSEFEHNVRDDLIREFKIRMLANIRINGTYLNEYPEVEFLDLVDRNQKQGTCKICQTATSQNSSSPSLLSYENFDILDIDFITNHKDNLIAKGFDNVIGGDPICVFCQISLSIRSQQFESYNTKNHLYTTVHPVNSTSVASYTRFQLLLKYIKSEILESGGVDFSYNSAGRLYEDSVGEYLSSRSGVEDFINREGCFNIGKRMNEATCRLTIPNETDENIIKLVLCCTIAGLFSGLNVCITRKPQLHINTDNQKKMVSYGPELESFEEIINYRTDILGIPSQIKILDNLVNIGDKLGSTDLVLRRYSQMNEKDVIPGSRLFSQIQHLIDGDVSEIARMCTQIDSLSAQNNIFSNDLITVVSSMGHHLSDVVDVNNSEDVNNIVVEIVSEIESWEVNTKEEVINKITDMLSRHTSTSLDISDVRRGGCAYQFAYVLADFYETNALNQEGEYSSLISAISSGTVTRTMLNLNTGDKKYG